MLIQKQIVMNHATLKPQLWPFFIILRGWEQELLEKQKLTSTLHSSLMWSFSSLAIPIHSFFFCLLFSSSFQKTSPQWISLKRDSLPSDRWTPFLTPTFCLWASMTREVKYCWSNLERDLVIVTCWHPPPCLCSVKHLARKKNPAKNPETQTNNYDGKAAARQLLPVILYWIHESPGLEQLLTHSSPPSHAVSWNNFPVFGNVQGFVVSFFCLTVTTSWQY